MSNMGLEVALKEKGLAFHRAAVGDRDVLEMMKEKGLFLGGEPSGHVLFLKHHTTGDGLLTALLTLKAQKVLGGDLLPHGGRFHLIQVLKKDFQASPLPDQLGRRLLPDALHAGDGVGRVPGQGPVVHPLGRLKPILLPKPLRGDQVTLRV